MLIEDPPPTRGARGRDALGDDESHTHGRKPPRRLQRLKGGLPIPSAKMGPPDGTLDERELLKSPRDERLARQDGDAPAGAARIRVLEHRVLDLDALLRAELRGFRLTFGGRIETVIGCNVLAVGNGRGDGELNDPPP